MPSGLWPFELQRQISHAHVTAITYLSVWADQHNDLNLDVSQVVCFLSRLLCSYKQSNFQCARLLQLQPYEDIRGNSFVVQRPRVLIYIRILTIIIKYGSTHYYRLV